MQLAEFFRYYFLGQFLTLVQCTTDSCFASHLSLKTSVWFNNTNNLNVWNTFRSLFVQWSRSFLWDNLVEWSGRWLLAQCSLDAYVTVAPWRSPKVLNTTTFKCQQMYYVHINEKGTRAIYLSSEYISFWMRPTLVFIKVQSGRIRLAEVILFLRFSAVYIAISFIAFFESFFVLPQRVHQNQKLASTTVDESSRGRATGHI